MEHFKSRTSSDIGLYGRVINSMRGPELDSSSLEYEWFGIHVTVGMKLRFA